MLIQSDTTERMVYMLTTVEKIKVIMKRNNFTMTELANQLNCSRQNLSNKMSRNNFDERELTAIADVLGCELEINFINRATGEKIAL
jgi:transcriptional regulator with XRE-family HTH domain